MDISAKHTPAGTPAGKPHRQYSVDFIVPNPADYTLFIDAQSEGLSIPFDFLESLPLPLFVKDLDGAFIACNQHFVSMFGRGADEIIGRTLASLLDPTSAAIHISADEMLIKSGLRIVYETGFSNAGLTDGMVRIIKYPLSDKEGNLNGIIGMVSEFIPSQRNVAANPATDPDSAEILRQYSAELEERNSQLIENIAGHLKIENEMLHFKNRLEIALKALNAGAWEWDPLTSIFQWSDRCYELFGLTTGMVTLKSLLSRVHRDDRDRVKEMWSRITGQEGWFDLEFRVPRNQTDRWIRVSGYYLTGNESTPERVTGVMADISEEMDYNQRLLRSQQLFKAVIEDQTELICRIRPDGSLSFINQAFARFFADTSEHLLTQSLGELISPKDFAKILLLQLRIKPSKSLSPFEQRIVRSDQSVAILQWTMRGIYLNGDMPDEFQLVGRDVTEIEKSREALRKSEEMFRLIAENSKDIISIHPTDGTIEYVSPSVKFILGYLPEQLIGSKGQDIVYEEDIVHLHTCNESLKISDEPVLLSFRLKDKQGNLIWFESMIQRQVNHKGKTTGRVIAVSRNIQSRKLVEEQQKITEQQLKEANLTKDKFFSIIAHDLRSPFTSILGFTRLLNDEYDDFTDEERKMMVKQIQNSTESTFQLLDNLLAWAKTQLGRSICNPVSFGIESLINDTVRQTSPQARLKHIDIVAGMIDDVTIQADHNMISTALRNLLSNAIKFSFPDGVIKINTRLTDGLLEISITDEGTGMPPETLQSLFSLNEQVPSTKGTANEKGTGLGLILCREFVERNGGTIHAVSEVGKGSTFSIVLPVNAEITA